MEFNLFWVELQGENIPHCLCFFYFFYFIYIQLFPVRLMVGKSARGNPERYGVVLSSLFFKEVWKNGTLRGLGRMFTTAKRKATKVGYTDTVSRTVCWSYPRLPFGIAAHTFFHITFHEIAKLYVLVQYYPWFKCYFPLFWGMEM